VPKVQSHSIRARVRTGYGTVSGNAATGQSGATSLAGPWAATGSGCSTCHSSIASITAESFASRAVAPLPWVVLKVSEAGRIAVQTGSPTQSNPVRSATRVMP
jgi:hypothetical protein